MSKIFSLKVPFREFFFGMWLFVIFPFHRDFPAIHRVKKWRRVPREPRRRHAIWTDLPHRRVVRRPLSSSSGRTQPGKRSARGFANRTIHIYLRKMIVTSWKLLVSEPYYDTLTNEIKMASGGIESKRFASLSFLFRSMVLPPSWYRRNQTRT